MAWEAWATLALLVGVFALLIQGRLHPAVVMLGALVVAGLFKLAPIPALLSGFSNQSAIVVAAMFVVAAGLWRTGAVTLLAGKLFGIPDSERSALTRVLPPVAAASAFLNNTPIVAMMIPALGELARAGRLVLAKLAIPLSFASILGGSLTLLGTSANLVVAGQVAAANEAGADIPPLGLFSPLPALGPAVLVGLAFLIVLAPRLLRAGTTSGAEAAIPVFRARFTPGPRLVGRTVAQAGLADTDGRRLVGRTLDGLRTGPDLERPLGEGEQLTFDVRRDELPALWKTIGLLPVGQDPTGRHTDRLVAAVVSPASELVGSTYADLVGETGTGAALVGVSRAGLPVDREDSVAVGDLLALEVDRQWFYLDRQTPDFVLVKKLSKTSVRRTSRVLPAAVITVAMIAVAALGWVPLVVTAPAAAFLMVGIGALPGKEAARALDYGVLGALVGAIGLGATVESSGLAAKLAQLVVDASAGSALVALGVVLVAGTVATNVITNTAAAALLFPVAVQAATLADANPLPFVLAVLASANFAFITPTGYQTNMMVMEPGGYRFSDFVRVGGPLTVLVLVVTWLVIPLVAPL